VHSLGLHAEEIGSNAVQGQIGYVPESLTHQFDHECTAGFLEWVAGNSEVPHSLLGASLKCMPAVRVVHMQVLPEELVAAADLSASLPASVWAALQRLHLERYFGRCQLTGLSSVSLNPEEVWIPLHGAAVCAHDTCDAVGMHRCELGHDENRIVVARLRLLARSVIQIWISYLMAVIPDAGEAHARGGAYLTGAE
jgi:hypothetical protein